MEPMKQYRRMMVCLSCTDDDASLIQYVGMSARLDTLEEVRFVHVVPGSGALNEVAATAQQRVESAVAECVGDTWPNIRLRCDVLAGPLLDRLIQYSADEQIDLLVVGHRLSPTTPWGPGSAFGDEGTLFGMVGARA